ncbi:MAG: DUF1572 domain-containing protein [Acidobacteria bacterium]|nr:DUF1572 domain-containing protein [Acidobacteriota bacterium]
MTHQFSASYLSDVTALFHFYKRLAEGAMEQVQDQELLATLDPEMNSIALIVKHMAGNMRSRWTNFLTSDGEKPDRNRDSEFVAPPRTRSDLMKLWNEGWERVFETLSALTDHDLPTQVTIRGEPHSVLQAINRQLAHYAYHCGQIVFVAKHFKAEDWKSLSVPRNRSEEFTRRVRSGELSQR